MPEDYNAFEAAIIADYDAQSAVERELVLPVCFGGCAVPPPWKLACSKSKLTTCVSPGRSVTLERILRALTIRCPSGFSRPVVTIVRTPTLHHRWNAGRQSRVGT